MHAQQMIAAHPNVRGEVNTALVRCIEACFDCAQVCVSCADVCLTSGLIATRRSGGDAPLIEAQLKACELACGRCAAECERHAAEHQHCRICAETCRHCERACREAISSLPGTDAARR